MIWPSVKFRKLLYISCFYINDAYLRSDSNILEQNLHDHVPSTCKVCRSFVCGRLASALSRPVCVAHAYIPVSVCI